MPSWFGTPSAKNSAGHRTSENEGVCRQFDQSSGDPRSLCAERTTRGECNAQIGWRPAQDVHELNLCG